MNQDYINSAYVSRQMHRASKANSQQEEDDALYRAGTHMEVLDTNRANLSPEQREAVRNAAKEVLGE